MGKIFQELALAHCKTSVAVLRQCVWHRLRSGRVDAGKLHLHTRRTCRVHLVDGTHRGTLCVVRALVRVVVRTMCIG